MKKLCNLLLLISFFLCGTGLAKSTKSFQAANPGDYKVTEVAKKFKEPMQIDIAPDGKIFVAERWGKVKLLDAETGNVETLVEVEQPRKSSNTILHGLVLDPDFETNGFIYVNYAADEYESRRISRYTFDGEQLTDEKILLEFYTTAGSARSGHAGGGMAMDHKGNLYTATGDNTLWNRYRQFGMEGEDVSESRDAARSAGNTQDLRGKIIRIKPEDDGTYSIPEGNLFDDPEKGKPEIYVMGLRNPFRISVDNPTGWLLWGEVGADHGSYPPGVDEFNLAHNAGNFGWPFCLADNKGMILEKQDTVDCNAPQNHSQRNTGMIDLPPANPALIWYTPDETPEFPELGSGGRVAIGGPVYRFDQNLNSPVKLPATLDGSWLIVEYSRGLSLEVKLDQDGKIQAILPFLPDIINWSSVLDAKIGPDGAYYALRRNGGSIYKIEYHGEHNPISIRQTAKFKDEVTFNLAPNRLSVQFRHSAKAPKAEIMNVNGKVISNLKLQSNGSEGNENKIKWSGSWNGKDANGMQVVSGIYFLRFGSNGTDTQVRSFSWMH